MQNDDDEWWLPFTTPNVAKMHKWVIFLLLSRKQEHTTFLISSELTKSRGKSNSFKPPNLMLIFTYLFYWECIKKVYYQIPTYPVIPYQQPQYDTLDQLDLITVVWLYDGFLRFYIKIIFKNLPFILASWSKKNCQMRATMVPEKNPKTGNCINLYFRNRNNTSSISHCLILM